MSLLCFFFFSSRRRHTRYWRDWSSDVCSSDLAAARSARVVVPDYQLSLAIGEEGQNARLAARLTGWRVDIRSETEFAAEEADMAYEEDEASGRCAAIMSTGKRCPNASLPGSRYCGLPAHQELEGKDTDQVEAEAEPQPEEAAADADAGVPERGAEEVVEPV